MTGHIRDIPQVVGKPAGYVNDATGTQHVVYRGDADYNVINEVRWDGTGLHYTNLNLAAGGTPAGVATGRGDPAAYVFRAQGTEHVVYRGDDNHVHELRKDASGWHHGDLTAGRVPQGDAVPAPKYVPGKYGWPATRHRAPVSAPYLPVAALNLVTTSAGIRPRSLISMSCALAHSRISAAFRPPAGALRTLRAGRRPLARSRRAAPAYCASASRSARACSALRSISYSAPSSPKRTVPSASLPSMSPRSR